MRRKRDIVWGLRQYGLLMPFTIRASRGGAIVDVVLSHKHTRWDSWAKLRGNGWTIHKLEVRDAAPSPSARGTDT